MEPTVALAFAFAWHLFVVAIVLALLWWLLKAIFALPLLAPVAPYARVFMIFVVVAICLAFLGGELGAYGEWGVGYRRHW